MREEKRNYVGIGAPTLLSIVFTVLKLCGVISWSWWWVLCPLWIPIAIFMVILLIVLIIAVIVAVVDR